MRASFTTLGCPAWDLDTICSRARAYGFDGVDFRGYLDSLDVTRLPEFTTHGARTRRRLADAGLDVSGIGSSIRLCDGDERAGALEEARRTIGAARELGCRNVRVFGGGSRERSDRGRLAAAGCATMRDILALDGARDLSWLLETHDEWTSARDCRLLLDAIPDPSFGVLWDLGHTSRVGGERPAETIAAVGPRIGCTHVKDAVHDPRHPQAMKDGWRYVSPGTGELPLVESIELLHAAGYDGWLVLEHEKRWHPELPDPEVAFPAYAAWVRGVLARL